MSKLRERRSDFFLFSKHLCGAPSIGYKETSAWQAGSAPIDLATAMAVSGAAASSYMGLGSFPSLTPAHVPTLASTCLSTSGHGFTDPARTLP